MTSLKYFCQSLSSTLNHTVIWYGKSAAFFRSHFHDYYEWGTSETFLSSLFTNTQPEKGPE